MIIRNTTPEGDFTYGKGKSDYRTDLDGLILDVKTRLQSWKNDCFFALAEGVDYNNFLDVGTKDFLDSDIKRVILQTEGVIKITSYISILNRDSRGLIVSTEIETVYGRGLLELGL